MTTAQQLEATNKKFEALQKEYEGLCAFQKESSATIELLNKGKAESDKVIADQNAEIDFLKAEAKNVAAKVKEVEASVATVAATKAQEIVASIGVPPIATKPAEPISNESKVKELKGLEKVIAAFKERNAALK